MRWCDIESLVREMEENLLYFFGQSLQQATDVEIYQALVFSLRKELAKSWMESEQSIASAPRRAYYISLEYLPGKMLRNTLKNVEQWEFVSHVLSSLGRSMEHIENIEQDMGLGNGGLGRLAACFLESLASQKYPVRGYGLRYHYGVFAQEVWNGVQIERPERWLYVMNPWERRRDDRSVDVCFSDDLDRCPTEKELWLFERFGQRVRAIPFDFPICGSLFHQEVPIVTLRLWSTKESPGNFHLQKYNAGHLDQASINTSLTNVLYPNDNHEIGKMTRLKQEFLLSSASLQDILDDARRIDPSLDSLGDQVRIQINDTHPTLIIPELIRLLQEQEKWDWERAVRTATQCCSFTTHTVLKEAHEEWCQQRVKNLLPKHYQIIERLNDEFSQQVRQRFPGDTKKWERLSILCNGQVRMSHLAVYGSHCVNGVSRIHTDLVREQHMKDFVDCFPNRFRSITNGVMHRRWLDHINPELSEFISSLIGEEWKIDFSHISLLHQHAHIPKVQDRFLKIKEEKKREWIEFMQKVGEDRDECGRPIVEPFQLSSKSILDVQVKRIHEYKRQLMNVLHVTMLYHDLLNGADRIPRIVCIGGKASPGYVASKQILRLIHAVSRTINSDKRIGEKLRVIFMENYNISRAEKVIPAADLSEQISLTGTEASGTGNMKLAMNGALTIGTDDGANIEMRESISDRWWPFRFGMSKEEVGQPWKPVHNIYSEDKSIRRALDTLIDHTFSKSNEEAEEFYALHHDLLYGSPCRGPDPYGVLQDLHSLYQVQLEVESLYRDPHRWAEHAIHNIAGMGPFSSDSVVQKYAQEVWEIQPISRTGGA